MLYKFLKFYRFRSYFRFKILGGFVKFKFLTLCKLSKEGIYKIIYTFGVYKNYL